MLIRDRLLTPDAVQIVNRCAETDLRSDGRCSRFKLIGQSRISRLFKTDRADHTAATLKWIHLLQQFSLAVNDAAACWRKHLVSRQRIEIAIEILHVNF